MITRRESTYGSSHDVGRYIKVILHSKMVVKGNSKQITAIHIMNI